MNKTRRLGRSAVAMMIACGATLAVVLPAETAMADRRSRNDCKPSYSHHSRSHYGHSSRSKVGFSVHIGTGGYSKYHRGSRYYYGGSDCRPSYAYSYTYPRYRYYSYTPSYRYECYDTPRVNTYYNNYSYNTYTYPTPPSGATTYRVWQQELQTPAPTQTAPAYPSYNPGPAQPSPAPAAQPSGVVEWRLVDPNEQQRQLNQGSTKTDRPRASIFDDGVAAEGGSTPEQAWDRIRDGDYTGARAAFASLTQTRPDSSEMKLGFGLANALDGRDAAAAWSIRRAVEGGADLSGFGERVSGMDQTMEALAQRLADRAEADGTGDAWLVLGVVQAIRGERDAAGLAVLQGIEAGDRSEAMERLAGDLGIEMPADASGG